jgi:hypothetical protein
MSRVRQESSEYNGHCNLHTQFESGNKRLKVAIDVTTGEANTSLKNIQGKPNVPGATTRVYTEARDLMQATANQLGRPICYEFGAFVDSMKLWASDPEKGAKIFNWDEVNPRYQRHILRAIKIFHPLLKRNI